MKKCILIGVRAHKITMIEQTLQQYFGYKTLRPGQEEVIENLIKGQSAAAIFPTGAGKSLCYQLTALLLPHLTLVISPLLALMKDQLDFLHNKNIPAAGIDSAQTHEQMTEVMQQVRQGELKILMISVERLKNERFREFIQQVPISLLVIDEAHCISEWGHNFRPDYLKLPTYQQQLKIPQVLLLTATATESVIHDMQTKFAIAPEHVTLTGFYRRNLYLNVLPCPDEQKLQQLQALISTDHQAPTIVYVTLQKTAEMVARELQQMGVAAIAYHAGLPNEQRTQIQHEFVTGESACIVATIAFGMGIDKADIRRVIHYDLPKSIENYSQEIGRAGRDNQPSQCIILANKEHINVLENFVYGDTPDRRSIASVIEQIYANQPRWEVRLQTLSKESNIRQLPLKTLLVYLELKGVITSQFSYFANYRFKFLIKPEKILQYFQGERRSFVQAIFNSSSRARTWVTVDFDALHTHYQASRSRVITALEYFDEKGFIALQSQQMTDVYKVLNSNETIDHLTEELAYLFEQKEQNEIQRIATMVQFFQSEQCLSHTLASYFNDHQAPQHCGHCSVCQGRIANLPDKVLPPMVDEQIRQWILPYQQQSPTLASIRSLSRFLCGIITPQSTQLKAKKMQGFGKLENYPFRAVYTKLTQLLT